MQFRLKQSDFLLEYSFIPLLIRTFVSERKLRSSDRNIYPFVPCWSRHVLSHWIDPRELVKWRWITVVNCGTKWKWTSKWCITRKGTLTLYQPRKLCSLCLIIRSLMISTMKFAPRPGSCARSKRMVVFVPPLRTNTMTPNPKRVPSEPKVESGTVCNKLDAHT